MAVPRKTESGEVAPQPRHDPGGLAAPCIEDWNGDPMRIGDLDRALRHLRELSEPG
jgi:hypothetical protein